MNDRSLTKETGFSRSSINNELIDILAEIIALDILKNSESNTEANTNV
jgi:hypothetical protein